AIAMRAFNGQLDNRNPKAAGLAEKLKQRLSAGDYAAWERGQSCHRNHLENMPLFIAAIFAGLLAQSQGSEDSVGLTAFAVGWMVIRVAYTANYLVTETQGWSYVRSALYFAGSLWAFWVLGRSAWVVGSS
ncbi:hypothetical protein LTR53_012703, partial [Teratosphaeriaceae sp. CCFEE 6253]